MPQQRKLDGDDRIADVEADAGNGTDHHFRIGKEADREGRIDGTPFPGPERHQQDQTARQRSQHPGAEPAGRGSIADGVERADQTDCHQGQSDGIEMASRRVLCFGDASHAP